MKKSKEPGNNESNDNLGDLVRGGGCLAPFFSNSWWCLLILDDVFWTFSLKQMMLHKAVKCWKMAKWDLREQNNNRNPQLIVNGCA